MTPDEFEKTFVCPHDGRVLIVGSRVVSETREDRRVKHKNAVGVDLLAGAGVDEVMDLEKDSLLERVGRFDHVECISILEHARRPWLIAENVMIAMNPGATIYISVPFIWRVHDYPSDYWRMTTSAVESIFFDVVWKNLFYAWPTGHSFKKIPHVDSLGEGFSYFARTEVFGFGVRK